MMKRACDFLWNAKRKVCAFAADEEGATAAEYGIIAALIAVIIIGAIRVLGVRLQSVFSNITNALPSGSP